MVNAIFDLCIKAVHVVHFSFKMQIGNNTRNNVHFGIQDKQFLIISENLKMINVHDSLCSSLSSNPERAYLVEKNTNTSNSFIKKNKLFLTYQ